MDGIVPEFRDRIREEIAQDVRREGVELHLDETAMPLRRSPGATVRSFAGLRRKPILPDLFRRQGDTSHGRPAVCAP